MEIINSLKSRIGEAEENKICQFLEEPRESIEKSLDLTLNGMLGGLKGIAQRDGDASSISKVINDGGHSGDLTDNLLGLFGNSNKMNLLITIGKNINSHFYGDKVDNIVNEIGSKGGISKNSASSLFSLAAPLVLGVLGKNIKLENLDNEQFTSRLLDEKTTLEPELSSGLMSSLGFSENVAAQSKLTNRNKETDTEEAYRDVYQKRKKSSEDKWNWIAWVLLALLGLAVAYYTFKDKYLASEVKEEVITSISDSSNANVSEADIFEELDTDRNKNNDVEENDVEEIDSGEATDKSNTAQGLDANSSKGTAEESADINENSDTPTVTRTEARDTRAMSTKLINSRSFFSINNLSFKRNSAEISNPGSLNELIDFLYNNPEKRVEIAGTGGSAMTAEDRAYGLQGLLYEAGIDISRLKVLSYAVKGTGPVVVKIK